MLGAELRLACAGWSAGSCLIGIFTRHRERPMRVVTPLLLPVIFVAELPTSRNPALLRWVITPHSHAQGTHHKQSNKGTADVIRRNF
jgi:hypothetical protein